MVSVIGIVMIMLGAILEALFAGITIAECITFGLIMFGAGLACSDLWKKQKDTMPLWLRILSVALLGVGSFILGFMGQITEDQVKLIITYSVTIAMIITGLLIPVFNKKKKLKS